MEIEQARLLVLKTAWLVDRYGAKGAATEVAAIKVIAPGWRPPCSIGPSRSTAAPASPRTFAVPDVGHGTDPAHRRRAGRGAHPHSCPAGAGALPLSRFLTVPTQPSAWLRAFDGGSFAIEGHRTRAESRGGQADDRGRGGGATTVRHDRRHRRLGITAHKPMSLVRAHPPFGPARPDRGLLRRPGRRAAVRGREGPAAGLRVRLARLYPAGAHFQAAREAGTVEATEYDEGMLQWALYAASIRLPFLPTRDGLGSDVMRVNPHLRTVRSPYGRR